MRVSNVKVYDIEESLIASGYPMVTNIRPRFLENRDIERGKKLSKACDTGNGAHAQFMTGIRVSFDLTCSNKMWVEAERYRFLEFVSSQSTMHKIAKFSIKEQCNEYVDSRIIDIVQEKVDKYNEYIEKKDKDSAEAKRLYLEVLYSIPSGFELTARLTTNYRCLKNIWIQRKNHRLPEWREFCKWIETLPYAEEFICYEREGEKNEST